LDNGGKEEREEIRRIKMLSTIKIW